MDMQRLDPSMMARYEIDDRRPVRAGAVQFGMGETLLGVVDRLIDDADAALGPDARVGIACVQAGEAGYAALLDEQGGLYTVLVRGYAGEEAVRREQVVQCVLRAVDPGSDPGALEALARDPAVETGIVGPDAQGLRLAARFAALRRDAGLPEISWLCVDVEPAAVAAATEASPGASAPEERFHAAMAEGFAFRSGAAEAARLCAQMNYADGMIHLAEPCARLTICAGDAFRRRFPLDAAAGVRFVDAQGLRLARALKARVFDVGVFLMAAAGWLNGCATLCDCMKHERLRRFVGEAFTGELLPMLDDLPRADVEACAIECFGRWENPLNESPILKAAGGLLGRFDGGVLPMIGRWADARFEPPRRFAFALAATVMLYAGARPNLQTGRYEVARGRERCELDDDPAKLAVFATLSHDMPPDALAYAVLADRELWGTDLRRIDGLEARVALDIAAMQRDPGFLPQGAE